MKFEFQIRAESPVVAGRPADVAACSIKPHNLKQDSVRGFSIRGVSPGMSVDEVRQLWGQPECTFENVDYYEDCSVLLSGKIVKEVWGAQVEHEGELIIAPDSTKAKVAERLGRPDSRGCAGVMMCEGPFEGWRYERYGLTVSFSGLAGTGTILCESYEFVDLEWGDTEWTFAEVGDFQK